MRSLIAALDRATLVILHCSWQATVLFLIVLVMLAVFGRRVPARFRFLLWGMVFLRLVLPVVPSSPWSIFNLVWSPAKQSNEFLVTTEAVSAVSASPTVFFPTPPLERVPTDLLADERNANRLERSSESNFLPNVLRSSIGRLVAGALWLVGFVLLSGRFAIQLVKLRRRAAFWQELNDPTLDSILRRCQSRLSIRRHIRLRLAPDDLGPAVFGIIRPSIVLPERLLSELSEVEWEQILLHEAGHIARHDVAVQWLVTVVRNIYWFNPAVWFAEARMTVDREEACDAIVLAEAARESRYTYRQLLLRLVTSVVTTPACPPLVGMWSRKRLIRGRIERVIDYQEPTLSTSLAVGVVSSVLVLAGFTEASGTESPLGNDSRSTPISEANRQFAALPGRNESVNVGGISADTNPKAVDGLSTGNFSGFVRLKGTAPTPVTLVKRPDVNGGRPVLDESLEVRPAASNGISGVFIYLVEPPAGTVIKAPREPFKLRTDGVNFFPHCGIAHVLQPLVIKNDGSVLANTHMLPNRWRGINHLVLPGQSANLQEAFSAADQFPFSVRSDRQSWMQAWILVLDHPYAAVTDERGSFDIKGLPPGKYSFRVWHERAKFLENAFLVEVKRGATTMAILSYPLERFAVHKNNAKSNKQALP